MTKNIKNRGVNIVKIVVLDEYPLNLGEFSWDVLEEFAKIEVYNGKDHKDSDSRKTIERAKDADAIFTNKIVVNREVMDGLPNLKYIGVLATGYNIIDTDYAKEKGIIVTNIPSYGTEAVAQMVFAHILEITNHVAYHSSQVKVGEWNKRGEWCFWDYPLMELYGKTIGIIGYGNIGRKVGEIARAFEMNVLGMANNPNRELEDSKMKYASLDELLANSDVISLHSPLTDETEGIINKESISKMKDGVILINTSRGGLIIEEDLIQGLKTEKIKAAGLDVVNKEPIADGNPLLKLDNVFITPHISWAPVETRDRLMGIAIDNFRSYVEGNPINIIE